MNDETRKLIAAKVSETRVDNAVMRAEKFARDEVRLARLSRAERIAFGKKLIAEIQAEVTLDVKQLTEEKSYWREYSSIEWENKKLHINTSSGDWALFVDDQFVKEGRESELPEDLAPVYREFIDPDDDLYDPMTMGDAGPLVPRTKS